MKRTVFALALCLGVVGGCTDYRSDIFIQGRVPVDDCSDPSGFCPCTWKVGGTEFSNEATLPARGQQVASKKLELNVAFQLLNNTATPDVANANGESTSQANRDDAQVTQMDIDVAALDGTSIASETLVASGYVPGNGSQGTVIVDIMGKPLADALRDRMAFPKPNPASEDVLLTVVAKGNLISGSDFQTEPYQHQLHLDFTDYFASEPDTTGAYKTIAVLPDGGIYDEKVEGDGTQTLVDDQNAYANALLNPPPLPDGGTSASVVFGTCE